MGLDMFAFATGHEPEEPVDFRDPERPQLLHVWRKHPKLHGWLGKLYLAKGGKDCEFNCVNLQLSSGDLDRLEAAVHVGAVGRKHVADDLAFVAEARDCLARGLAVYYTSWW